MWNKMAFNVHSSYNEKLKVKGNFTALYTFENRQVPLPHPASTSYSIPFYVSSKAGSTKNKILIVVLTIETYCCAETNHSQYRIKLKTAANTSMPMAGKQNQIIMKSKLHLWHIVCVIQYAIQ
jgi:hypothetical protein